MPTSEPWPIFVISLRQSTDRRAEISRQFDGSGYAFEFIDAVDGLNGLGAEHAALIDREACLETVGRPMSDGEFATSLSHVSVYRRMREENLPGAVILEDDAELTPGFFDLLDTQGYLMAEFLQLEHRFGRSWRGRAKLQIAPGIHAERLAICGLGGAGYTLDLPTARLLEERILPVRTPIDWFPDALYQRRIYATQPKLIGHPVYDDTVSLVRASREALMQSQSKIGPGVYYERATGPGKVFASAYWRRKALKLATRKLA